MTSRLLGVAREVVLAAIFGASRGPEMDAYNVAFRVPNLLRDLFAEGAMTAAFVPTFTRTLTGRGRDAAWRLGNLALNALLVVTGVFVLLGIVFAEPITHLIASGDEFASVPGKLELTTLLTRLMMPFLTTIAVAVAMMGMLNSLHRFFVPALAPAMFNVATIVCAFALVPLMPGIGLPPIAGIALGTLLGGLGQIALQWPILRREGFRYQPVLDFKDPALREILRLMGPATIGLAAVQINVVVNTMLASSEPQGAVTWLNNAFRLMYLPIGLFGVSIATASLPDISRHAAAADRQSIRTTVSRGLRLMLMLNIPATIGLIALAQPIVAFILERGQFGPGDTAATAAALMAYAPGLVGYSAVKIASPTFYSLRDSRTPVTVSVATVLLNLVLNLTLVRILGFRGLALGTAIAAVFNAVVLLWLLGNRLEGLEARKVANTFARVLVAATAMGLAGWLANAYLEGPLPARSVLWLHVDVLLGVRLALSISAAVIVLVLAARSLRIEEFDEAFSKVIRRAFPSRRGRNP